MAATSVGSTRSGLRAGGIAAIVFAVLFVVGFLFVSDTPEGDESNLKWLRYYADSDNRRMIVIGAIVLALAAVAFLVFLGVLRERLRNAATGAEWVGTTAFASGLLFVAMLAVATLGTASVSASVEFGDAPVVRDADVLRTFESLGIGALVLFGAAAAGLLIITTSIAAGRVGAASALARGGGLHRGCDRAPRRSVLHPAGPVRAVDAGGRDRHAPRVGARRPPAEPQATHCTGPRW